MLAIAELAGLLRLMIIPGSIEIIIWAFRWMLREEPMGRRLVRWG